MGSGRRCPSAVRGADTAAICQAPTPPRSPALAPPTRPWNARPLDPPPPSARHPLAWSTLPLPARTTQSSSLPSRRKPFSLCEVSLHRSAHSASGPRPPGPRTLSPRGLQHYPFSLRPTQGSTFFLSRGSPASPPSLPASVLGFTLTLLNTVLFSSRALPALPPQLEDEASSAPGSRCGDSRRD